MSVDFNKPLEFYCSEKKQWIPVDSLGKEQLGRYRAIAYGTVETLLLEATWKNPKRLRNRKGARSVIDWYKPIEMYNIYPADCSPSYKTVRKAELVGMGEKHDRVLMVEDNTGNMTLAVVVDKHGQCQHSQLQNFRVRNVPSKPVVRYFPCHLDTGDSMPWGTTSEKLAMEHARVHGLKNIVVVTSQDDKIVNTQWIQVWKA